MDWPQNLPFVATITFDVDSDGLIHAADPEGWKHPFAISIRQYGPTVNAPRILETDRCLGMKQSFFVPDGYVKTYPRAVEAILEAAHEIGCHGWIHENPAARTLTEPADVLESALTSGGWFATFGEIVDHAEGLRRSGHLRTMPISTQEERQR